jgi:hypothetical protein
MGVEQRLGSRAGGVVLFCDNKVRNQRLPV